MSGSLFPFWVKKCGGNAEADHGGEYGDRVHGRKRCLSPHRHCAKRRLAPYLETNRNPCV